MVQYFPLYETDHSEIPCTFITRFYPAVDRTVRLKCGNANACLLYTSDAADERSSVDLGGRRIIQKKKNKNKKKKK